LSQRIFHHKFGKNSQSNTKTLEDHIDTLFDIADLPASKIAILMVLSVIPPEGINQSMFYELMPSYKGTINKKSFSETFEQLISGGWVTRNVHYDGARILLHPLIHHVVSTRCNWEQRGLDAYYRKLYKFSEQCLKSDSFDLITEFVRVTEFAISNSVKDSASLGNLMSAMSGLYYSSTGDARKTLIYLEKSIEIAKELAPEDRVVLLHRRLQYGLLLILFGKTNAAKGLKAALETAREVYPEESRVIALIRTLLHSIDPDVPAYVPELPETIDNDEKRQGIEDIASSISLLLFLNGAMDYQSVHEALQQVKQQRLHDYGILGAISVKFTEALLLSYNEDYRSAIALLDDVLNLIDSSSQGDAYPLLPAIYFVKILWLWEFGETEEASSTVLELASRNLSSTQVEYIKTFSDYRHDNGVVERMLGDMYQITQNYKEAITQYETALEQLRPDEYSEIASLYSDLADCFAEEQDYDAAIANQSKAVEACDLASKRPKERADEHRMLGYYYRCADNHQKAVQWFTSALELHSSDPEPDENGIYLSNLGLGITYALDKQPHKAIEHYHVCIRIAEAGNSVDKDVFVTLHEDLGKLYRQIGDNLHADEHQAVAERLKSLS
jgi:tetratricopeptide (TPR) repeat protein